MGARVNQLARQVSDLLNSPSLGSIASGRQPRFLVIGDRDYRSQASSQAERRDLLKKAKSQALKLDLQCVVWKRNEIENYLVDYDAIESAVTANLTDPTQGQLAKQALRRSFDEAMAQQRPEIQARIAEKIQHEDPAKRAMYQTVTREAEELLAAEWGTGASLCDAKKLLGRLRDGLQQQKIRMKPPLSEKTIIKAMVDVPEDVRRALGLIKRLAGAKRTKSKSAASSSAKGTKP